MKNSHQTSILFFLLLPAILSPVQAHCTRHSTDKSIEPDFFCHYDINISVTSTGPVTSPCSVRVVEFFTFPHFTTSNYTHKFYHDLVLQSIDIKSLSVSIGNAVHSNHKFRSASSTLHVTDITYSEKPVNFTVQYTLNNGALTYAGGCEFDTTDQQPGTQNLVRWTYLTSKTIDALHVIVNATQLDVSEITFGSLSNGTGSVGNTLKLKRSDIVKDWVIVNVLMQATDGTLVCTGKEWSCSRNNQISNFGEQNTHGLVLITEGGNTNIWKNLITGLSIAIAVVIVIGVVGRMLYFCKARRNEQREQQQRLERNPNMLRINSLETRSQTSIFQ